MSTLVTGGTGFVGRPLLHALHRDVERVITCSRHADRLKKDLGTLVSDVIQWEPTTEPLDLASAADIDSVINLMGEPIAAGRWSASKKKRIRDSRILGTRNLIEGILNSHNLPKVLVSASAVGIYGDCGEDQVSETHPWGTDFLSDVCQQWESEANCLREHGVRVVNLRIGIVLGKNGGTLQKLRSVFRWGAGGRLGSGKQWMSWIHQDDLTRMILWAVDNTSVHGPVNAVAPYPVRNKDLTIELAHRLQRPALLRAPKWGLRIVLGEFADSLLYSQRVIPEVALSAGFSFKFANLESALENLIA